MLSANECKLLLAAKTATEAEIILLLTKESTKHHRMDLNVKDEEGKTPLYIAAEAGNIVVVKALLHAGVDFKVRVRTRWSNMLFGETPRKAAKRNNHPEIVQLLDEYATKHKAKETKYNEPSPPNSKEATTATKPSKAKVPRHLPSKEILIEFVHAIEQRHIDTVKQYLSEGIDPNAVDENGDTLVHIAIQSHQDDILDSLLAAGDVDVTKCNKDGVTPLVLAIKLGHRRLASKIHSLIDSSIHEVDDESIQIDYEHCLGSDSFGTVYKGVYNNQDVAVKIPHANHDIDIRQKLKTLELCPSPYTVDVIAVASRDLNCPKVAMDLMDCGTLRDYIDAKRKGAPTKFDVTTLQVAWVLANALADLHLNGIIHRDIKPESILLSTKHFIKLDGLEISREWASFMTPRAGTLFYKAPEVMNSDGHYSYSADIYSFGIVIAEFDTLKKPYEDSDFDIHQLNEHIRAGTIRPSLSPDCENWVKELVEKCLVLDPKERPSAREVLGVLHQELHPPKPDS
ncbi:kinase [Thraustotheca clavata]|uniref:Kinase n=1 Tax=Thraustotheca clavata TaxID=74557 RepID=A0A1V9ZW71_9STRA|nr:kinase [Thraustotheca clavata]